MSVKQRKRLLEGMGRDHQDVGTNVTDPDGNVQLLHLDHPADLVRAIGKLHFLCAQSASRVVFRGQTQLHGGRLSPSLFRGAHCISATEPSRRSELLKGYLNVAWDPTYRSKSVTDERCLEPLLQHYGLKTSWIDVVDTIWPALWFATHESIPNRDPNSQVRRFTKSTRDYCYIICLTYRGIGVCAEHEGGVTTCDDCEIVDLRRAVNSIFIRPHCQHGCLIRDRSAEGDYWNLVQDVIRLPTLCALKWLGEGRLMSEAFMFPEKDHGLDMLIEHVKPPSGVLGDRFH
jgi:hypothetical protein